MKTSNKPYYRSIAIWVLVTLIKALEAAGEQHIVIHTRPAALDSNVIFNASFVGHVYYISGYICEWTDTAKRVDERNVNITTTNHWCQLETNYTRDTMLAYKNGTYFMSVKVYGLIVKDESFYSPSLLAKGNTSYNLTVDLNGELNLTQVLPRKPPPHVYATNSSLKVNSTVLDSFTDAHLNYTLFINSTRVNTSIENGTFELIVSKVGLTTLSAFIRAEVKVNDSKISYEVNRTAWLNRTLEFKDKISGFKYKGETVVPVETIYELPFECIGSSPFSFNWTVRQVLNNTSTSGYQENMDECVLHITDLQFEENVLYNIVVEASNDVSISQVNVTILAQNPLPSSQGSIAGIVIGCLIIALFCLLLVATAHKFDKRRRPVRALVRTETADFNFGTRTHSLYQNTMDGLNGMVVKVKDWVIEKRSKARQTHVRQEYEQIL